MVIAARFISSEQHLDNTLACLFGAAQPPIRAALAAQKGKENGKYGKTIQQAIKCLNVLVEQGMVEQPLAEFKKSCKLNYSERTCLAQGAPAIGTLYWVDQETSVSRNGIPFTKVIAEFEHRYNALVYHATHEFLEFGECLDLFYVSNNEEEWEDDLAKLKDGTTCAYVVNFDCDYCSEFGLITFKVSGGGVVRTG